MSPVGFTFFSNIPPPGAGPNWLSQDDPFSLIEDIWIRDFSPIRGQPVSEQPGVIWITGRDPISSRTHTSSSGSLIHIKTNLYRSPRRSYYRTSLYCSGATTDDGKYISNTIRENILVHQSESYLWAGPFSVRLHFCHLLVSVKSLEPVNSRKLYRDLVRSAPDRFIYIEQNIAIISLDNAYSVIQNLKENNKSILDDIGPVGIPEHFCYPRSG